MEVGVATHAPSSQPGVAEPNPPKRVRARVDIWTREIDETLVKLYFLDRKLGNCVIRGYRKRVYDKFKRTFPNSKFSEQNVGDRINNIVNHGKYVPQNIMDKIKDEVETRLNWDEINGIVVELEQEAGEEAHIEDHTPENEEEVPVGQNSMSYHEKLESEYLKTMGEEMQKMLDKFRNTDPVDRPFVNRLKPSRALQIAVKVLNTHVIPTLLSEDTSFEELHTIIYCAAAVCETKLNKTNKKQNRKEKPKDPQKPGSTNKTPKHIYRLENRIKELRKDYSRINQFEKGTNTRRLNEKIEAIKKRFEVHAGHGDINTEIADFKDTIKQTLNKLNNRLQRYRNTINRKTHNTQFKNNEKLFYRKLETGTVNETPDQHPPSKEDLETFWGGLWSNPVEHNKNAKWIEEEIKKHKETPDMTWEEVTREEVTRVSSKVHNWKAPGLDNIHNYWLKSLVSTHSHIAKFFNKFLNEPQSMPSFLTRGRTYMLPKDEDTKNPAKYRPITCLTTTYKLLTGILTDRIYGHLERYGILAEEQKGCRRKAQGCKEQVLIDSVIVAPGRKLHTAYIDYKKAFDSVPHSWILQVMEIYKIAPQLIEFLSHAMKKWETVLILRLNGMDPLQTSPIRINRGIFQGDSLSPLLFCMAMNPLSTILNKVRGPKVSRKKDEQCRLTHLLYMDDIKLYGNNDKTLKELLRLTEEFSADVGMEFGISKCRIRITRNGKPSEDESRFLCSTGEVIEGMEDDETYKYLGFLQSKVLEHQLIKTKLQKQFKSRVRRLLKTKLNSKNLCKAINTYAIPVLTYSFGVIKWRRVELRQLRTSLSKLMTKHCMHHPKSAVQRVSLPRKLGGRGIIDITHLHDTQVHNLREYFKAKSRTSELLASVCKADNHHTPLNLLNTIKHVKPPTKNELNNFKMEKLKGKELHGRHQQQLANKIVDKDASNVWLTRAGLFPETEGFLIAIQDEVIKTKNYKKHILNDKTIINDNCRLCKHATENIQHITSACLKLAGTDYTHRHNQVGKIIHQKLAKKHNLIKETVPYYEYKPASVLENEHIKIYWDRTIHTDKTTRSNRPDITFVNKKEKTAYLIDIAVPNTHNLKKKMTEKLDKYAGLAFQFKTLHKVKKVEVIPLVLSATGVIPKALKCYIERIGLPSGTYIEMQKAAILNTCNIVRKFLDTPEQPIF